MRRVIVLSLSVLATACAWSGTAYAQRIALSGQFVQETPGVPVCTPDPHDLMVQHCTFTASIATVTGTWRGENVANGTYTINLTTGETAGRFDETFTGSSSRGGFGTIASRGTFTLGATDPNTGAQSFRTYGRLVGGTGDFAGSRGRVTYTGNLTAGVGTGTYTGVWRVRGL